jgi:hypothetical protein
MTAARNEVVVSLGKTGLGETARKISFLKAEFGALKLDFRPNRKDFLAVMSCVTGLVRHLLPAAGLLRNEPAT